jgi:uncharacterized protein with ATP-grasp and redox domains
VAKSIFCEIIRKNYEQEHKKYVQRKTKQSVKKILKNNDICRRKKTKGNNQYFLVVEKEGGFFFLPLPTGF